jgi:hypothetical protein
LAKLQDIEVDDYFRDCVGFEPLQVKEEYVRVAADFAYWNERAADARKVHLLADADLERTKARVELEIRAEAALGGPKITEGTVSAKVTVHPDVVAAVENAIMADTERARFAGRVGAISKKMEALVSYGAHVRREMDGDPQVSDFHRQQALVRENG